MYTIVCSLLNGHFISDFISLYSVLMQTKNDETIGRERGREEIRIKEVRNSIKQ